MAEVAAAAAPAPATAPLQAEPRVVPGMRRRRRRRGSWRTRRRTTPTEKDEHPRELLAHCFVLALNVNNAALLASLFACDEDFAFLKEPGVAAFVAAGFVFLAFFVVCAGFLVIDLAKLLHLLWRRGSCEAEKRELWQHICWDGGAKRPGEQQRVSDSSVARDLIESILFAIVVGLLVLVIAPVEASCGEGVCSMLLDIRCFGNSVSALLRHSAKLWIRLSARSASVLN
ncbi:unnamed protein product [Urochloa humidicola]